MDTVLPLLDEFSTEKAIIEPTEVVKPEDIPEAGVICFPSVLIEKVIAKHPVRELRPLRTMMGRRPIYEIQWNGERLAIFCPGITAPLAVAITEEVIARGCRKLVAFGSAGVLDRTLVRGHLVVPTSTVRDEGTSFHYAAPSREIAPTEAAVAAIKSVLSEHGVPFTLGKTWTTDGFYRETPSRVARRKAEGCITVEMEAAALFALAQFRQIPVAQMLWCGDDVSGDQWDARDGHAHKITLQAAFELAAEACLRL